MTQTGRYGEWVELKLLFFFFFLQCKRSPEHYAGVYWSAWAIHRQLQNNTESMCDVWDTVNGRVSQHKIFPFSTLHSCDLTFILNTFPHHESNVNVLSAFNFPATPFCANQNQPKDMVVYLKEQFVILFRRPLLAVRWREHPLHRPLVRG